MSSLNRHQLRELYRHLLLTRGLEERLERLWHDGRVSAPPIRSLGQEATGVGGAFALREGDWVAPSSRELGAVLVRGLAPREVLVRHLSMSGSPVGSSDQADRFTAPALGVLGPTGPLGTQLCVMNGVALGFRLRAEPRVCLAYLGDGASRTGAAHEGLNFAAVQGLPVLVLLVHNGWASGTRSDRQAAVADWLDVAGAYGLPAESVDGNDVLQVYDSALRGVQRARRGEGPSLIVAETYRMQAHADDTGAQHDAEALEAWARRDPITGFESYLVETGFESRPSLAVLREGVRRELDLAVEEALGSVGTGLEKPAVPAVPGESEPTPWTRRPMVYPDLQTHESG